jgi:hypothetical protein
MKWTEVVVICEGQTEESFINSLVRPALNPYRISIRALMAQTSPGHRGGALNFDRFKKAAKETLHSKPGLVVTSLIDLYQLNTSFPKFEEAARKQNLTSKLACLEQALHAGVIKFAQCTNRPERFIAHIQPHEFEALLFSDVGQWVNTQVGWPDSRAELEKIRKGVATPEDINGKPETAPSKRLIRLLKNPSYRKVRHAIQAAEKITLPKIEQECPHFKSWMDKLRALATP